VVNLPGGVREDALLFGESASRVILTLREKDLPALDEVMGGLARRPPVRVIGRVEGTDLRVQRDGETLFSRPVALLHRMWHSVFPALMTP
jgi:phosphoribosylformylglycinamidine synthase subunit PurL